jgi:hypothetical protein
MVLVVERTTQEDQVALEG